MHSKSSGPTQQLALCLGSRHANGHVRETCLRQLLAHDCDWVLPFVVRAAGEYVLEIAEHLTAQTHRLSPQLRAFCCRKPRVCDHLQAAGRQLLGLLPPPTLSAAASASRHTISALG
jgi:hypothetical protein